MASLKSVAGATIEIGTALEATAADVTASTFSAISWTNIDGWETAGDFGDTATVISTALINRGRVAKQLGTRDSGEMENQFALLTDDAGMDAVLVAAATNASYAFRIRWDDDPDDGANSAPTTAYFIAYVSSVRVVNGDANSVSMRSVTLAIDSNVVLVDALNHVA